MTNEMLLIKTHRSSVGGNAISLEIFTVDRFIETYKDAVLHGGYYMNCGIPDIRYCRVNGRGGYLIKDLGVSTFEKIFDPANNDLGKLLWYYPEEKNVRNKYPFFRKAVYEKYGIKAKKTYVPESRGEYTAEVIE